MSNQVALFEGINQLPAHLQNYELDEATKKLAGGGGGLRISIRGGVWRLLDGGEEIGRNEDRAINVVIVASSPDTARTYYEGAYVEGESKPPTCWSSDGKAPDAEVEHKQAASCAMCPQNVAGSGQNDSRACRFSRALAVTMANDIGGKVFKMQMPAQSIFGKPENGVVPLQAYAKQLVAHKVSVSAVVTEMRFDTTSATPKVGFKPVRFLTREEFELAKEQGMSPEAQDAIKTSVFAQDGGEALPKIAGTNPQQEPVAETPAEPATLGNTATVPATPPKRQRAKPAAAATAQPTTPATSAAPADPVPTAPAADAGDDEEAALLAALAAARAKKAAAAQAAVAEPVVVTQQPAQAAPAPASAAAVLAAWDADDDDE